MSVDAEMEREEAHAVEAIRNNPKYFNTYARRRNRTRPAVGPLVVAGKLIGDGDEIANVL